MSFCEGFFPIEPESAKVVVLGTMPSIESINQNFYYAHPRNAFWFIIGSMVHRELQSVTQKKHALEELGIFLWDVLGACNREGSLDSAIKNPSANDFTWVFKKHPHIKAIVFNGKTAETLFKRHVFGIQSLPEDLEFVTLPSTSPANARLTLEDKRLLWQEKLSALL
ncbi:DNA-deoxyinosine glycosylase [Thiomicrorhabdus sp. ZW0627]|uniref:DNA-deoxyinosine glycosylase n=1 Tax=Thiomicrorhabdus sp. ZW0627 TaxID=3039774 RepID=UPI0024366647|nr:DNA-deoxyinosine glycosylase [Thiomicrorhabdus sp. ZW0627]MDG6773037.1 DNA-deoxyinosine glycosylase [Thiomicrorhabdus sp. ZW0627]